MTSRTGTPPGELTSTSGFSCEVLTTDSAALTSVDRLFGSGINASIFHHPRFLPYHSADKFPHTEGSKDGGLVYAALSFAKLSYGASIGDIQGRLDRNCQILGAIEASTSLSHFFNMLHHDTSLCSNRKCFSS
jgi:hypothetical protein